MKSVLLICVFACAAVVGQDARYTPGVTYQTTNPNYPARNPFYFEGRVDWDLLKINQASNAWEFAQRGIHKQDDLEDFAGAIDDYRKAISMNNLQNGTCQIVTSAPAGFGQNLDPAPCMFTARLRLGNLLKKTNPAEAIGFFQEVMKIDPLHLGVEALIGEAYTIMAEQAADPSDQQQYRQSAVAAYRAELSLSPVTELSKKLTGDEANNAHVHWALAALYEKIGDLGAAVRELDLYLKATKWHSDTYPWRITLAQKRMAKLQHTVSPPPPMMQR